MVNRRNLATRNEAVYQATTSEDNRLGLSKYCSDSCRFVEVL
jgi:hypothetical protein